MKVYTLVIIFLFSLCYSLSARGWYFSTTGSDSNAGTIDKPLKTLSTNTGKAKAGDTIYVRGGTYTDHYWVTSAGGTASAPIVITAYKDEKVVISTGNTTGDAFSFGASSTYYEVCNLEIFGSLGKACRFGVNLTSASFVKIKNCIIHDCLWSAIYANPASHDITIENCTIYNNVYENAQHKANSWRCAVNLEGKNTFARGCDVYKNHGEGIGLYGDGNKAIGNKVHDNWSVNIYLCNTLNATCESNYVYTDNDPNFFRSLFNVNGAAYGIMLANEGSTNFVNGNVIINNIVVGGKVPFFFWKGYYTSGLLNCVIANNLFKDGVGGCVMIQDASHSNTLFCNNILYQSVNTYDIVEASTWLGADSRLTIKNNLFFGQKYYSGSSKYGTDSIHADPMFISSLSGLNQYKVDSLSSPCVEAGLDYNKKSVYDFFGSNRVKGKIDIGPYETFRLIDAIHEIQSEHIDYKVFANHGQINIVSAKSSSVEVVLYSLQGKVLWIKKVDLLTGQNCMTVPNMTNDTYLISIKDKHKTNTTKLFNSNFN